MRNTELRKPIGPDSSNQDATRVHWPLPSKYRRSGDVVEADGLSLRWAFWWKRIFDLAFATFLLLLLSPFFLFLLVWIPLSSRGSAFFTQNRRGLHGRSFRMYKFRTMAIGAHLQREEMLGEKSGERLLYKHKTDPRVTPLGRFLRKYSVDELPQLLNVLKGEMSMVGPRPLLHEDFQDPGILILGYKEWARDRHCLWPGITGLWQVSGRNNLSFEESMRLDLQYVTHWSPWLDFVILLKTLPAIFRAHGAY